MEHRSSPTRRAALASTVLISLLLAACGGRGPVGASPAAQIGDRFVSVDELNRHREATAEAIRAAEKDGSGRIPAGTADQLFTGESSSTVPLEGVATALNDLVRREALAEVADIVGAEVTDADRDEIRAGLAPEVSEGLPADYIDVQVEIAALQKVIGEVTEVDEDDVRAIYEDQRGGYTQVCISMVAVDAEDRAEEARRRLESGEEFASVFEDLNTLEEAAETSGEIPCRAAADLEPSFGPSIYDVTEGEALDPVRADESLWLVPLVTAVDQPTFEDIEAEIRPNAVQLNIDRHLRSVLDSVRINPRFGTWNTETGTIDPPAAPAPRTSDTTGI